MAPQAADGFYLVNCTAPTPGSPPGTVSLRSGIAYYADMFANHNNQDEQPTSFVYTDSEGNTTWESESGQSASFPDIPACPAFTFSWTVGINAQAASVGSVVGSATADLRGGEKFTVFRDNGRALVMLPDGYECFCIYVCQKSS